METTKIIQHCRDRKQFTFSCSKMSFPQKTFSSGQTATLALSAAHTVNCRNTAEHSGTNTAAGWDHNRDGQSLQERKGENRNLHSHTSTQHTSAKSTSFK